MHDLLTDAVSDKRKDKDSLENHVATVAHYIDFVLANKRNPDVMSHHLPHFTEYLLTRSWKKMRRRIHHWSSQGFIYQLSRVDETALRAAVEPAVSPLRNDIPLAIKLVSLDSDDLIRNVIKYKRTDQPLMFSFLLTACQKMQARLRSDRQDQSGERLGEPDDSQDESDDPQDKSDDPLDEPDDPLGEPEVSGLYNRDTCVEFHQLLVSTLLSLGKGLDAYASALTNYRKDPESFVDLANHAGQVYDCVSLLWIIAYSRILENHLKVLHDKRWIKLPTNSKEKLDKYIAFTKFQNDKDQVVALDGVDGGVEDDESGEEDEDYLNIANKATSTGKLDLAVAFREWIRLQVDRFQAARKITSFLKRTRTPPVNLTLLAVRHPDSMIAGEAMEPWRNTIRDIYSEIHGGAPEAEKTIRILETIIEREAHTNPKSIFAKFISDTYQYDASVHCEIVMAALKEYCGSVIASDALKDRIQVWFHFSYHPAVCKSDAWHRISMTA